MGSNEVNVEWWLGRTNAHIGAVEKQAHNKDHGHAACCGNKPKRKSAFSPARLPGNCRPAVGKAIRNATVWQIGFLTAHDSGLQLKK